VDVSNRVNWFFRQRVAENELDLAFDQVEQADRDFASDIGMFGIISGGEAVPHEPFPDLRIGITGPTRAYDRLGRRVFIPVAQTVDCSRDLSGLPTEVMTPGNERWLSVFIRFNRTLSDPRIDGGGQQVFFRRDESFEIALRQGPEAPASTAERPSLVVDELLVCDVRRAYGQTQILADDLDVARRQRFLFTPAGNVGVFPSGWNVIVPAQPNVHAALDSIDGRLFSHLQGVGDYHKAEDILLHRLIGWIPYNRLQDFLEQLVFDLTAGGGQFQPGSSRIGAERVDGTPYSLDYGSVNDQLKAIVGYLNDHAKKNPAHAANTISATTHGNIGSTNVQGQLEEIVSELALQASGNSGGARVGVDAITGTPTSLAAGTVRAQLSALLTALNNHATAGGGSAHTAQAIAVADTNNRLNATTVEGAIGEALEALEAGHFRVNETNPGQHRTIRQPSLGELGLILDSLATGRATGRMRIIADGDGIWFTLNAMKQANGSWLKDAAGASSGFRLSSSAFELVSHNPGNSTTSFASWLKRYSLGMENSLNSTWEVTNTVTDHGRLSMEVRNFSSTQGQTTMGTSVTFRVVFDNAPSSITLTAIDNDNGAVGLPTVAHLDRYGFYASHTSLLASGASKKWIGRYTTVA
jgi:hypothetical protein